MEELDIKQIFKSFWKKKILIILITLLGAILGYVFNTYFTTPKYKSSTTFLLIQDISPLQEAITTNDVTLNTKLVNNYAELIKSDIVLDEVCKQKNIKQNKDQLKELITVNEKKDTEFITITVITTNPQEATDIANTVAQVFISKVKEIYNKENVKIVNIAFPPEKPYNINPMKFTILGGLIGLTIILLLLLLLQMLNDKINAEIDIENHLGLKTLATFKKQNTKSNTLYWNPKANYFEGFKALRTNLQFVKRESDIKTIAITSSMPEEGKSWVASNLALAFAKADYNVCLIDADMRKGIQHKLFNVKKSPGLSELIQNDDNISDYDLLLNNYIKDTKLKNLSLLTCGKETFESSELLASNRLIKLISVLKNNFDIIIFDSTPSTILSDSTILCRLADTSIIVIENEKTKVKDIKKIKSSILDVGGDVAGIVINKVHSPDGKKYYYYAH